MPVEEKKKAQVSLTVPLIGYPRTMRFNRFSTEPMGSFIVCHCGFIGSQGLLMDVFSFAMSKDDLKTNSEHTLRYLDRLADVPDLQQENWSAPVNEMRPINAIRIITMSHSGESAELCLCAFSLTALLTKKYSGDKATFDAQPVALLACDKPMQKYVIQKLFLEYQNA